MNTKFKNGRFRHIIVFLRENFQEILFLTFTFVVNNNSIPNTKLVIISAEYYLTKSYIPPTPQKLVYTKHL